MSQSRKKGPDPASSGAAAFVENEWLESLLRMRRERPNTYERSISQPVKLTVERYAELRYAARAEEEPAEARLDKFTDRV